MKKWLISTLALAGCVQLMVMPISAEWAKIGENPVYIDEGNNVVKGWKHIDGSWYYFQKENGYLSKGWLHENGCWYYLSDTDGRMRTGWLASNKSWYYFNPANGIMYANQWLEENGSRYYFMSNGQMATGRVVIDRQVYEFASDGAFIGISSESALDGLLTITGQLYYYKQNVMQTGWQELAGKRYYFDVDGSAIYGWYLLNGESDYFVNGQIVEQDPSVDGLRSQIARQLDRLSVNGLVMDDEDLLQAADIRAFEGTIRPDSVRVNNTYFTTILDEQKIGYLDAKEMICTNVHDAAEVIMQVKENYVFMKAFEDEAFSEAAVGIANSEDGYQVHILLIEK